MADFPHMQNGGNAMIEMPEGFLLAAANADFRGKGQNRNDLCLVLSETPAVTAGTFTTNRFPAAPVTVCRNYLSTHGIARGVVLNSGQANACTGQKGMENCLESLRLVSAALRTAGKDVPPEHILPASTGVIGAQMDMGKWEKAVPELAASLGSIDLEGLARAMMTTDRFPKMAGRTVEFPDGTAARIAGAAKGAGMICPNMATTLAVVMCDAAVNEDGWKGMVKRATDKSFNRVCVDGDTSTNDTILALANGASGCTPAREHLPLLENALAEVLCDLAYMLVQDGEGATKVMHIHVSGAKSSADADRIARTVGNSQLVKTAMFGRDPNWGRIVAAVGRSGADFRPGDVRVTLCGVTLFEHGMPAEIDFDKALEEPLAGVDLPLEISVGSGDGEAVLLASDLSHGYVTLNSDYRS